MFPLDVVRIISGKSDWRTQVNIRKASKLYRAELDRVGNYGELNGKFLMRAIPKSMYVRMYDKDVNYDSPLLSLFSCEKVSITFSVYLYYAYKTAYFLLVRRNKSVPTVIGHIEIGFFDYPRNVQDQHDFIHAIQETAYVLLDGKCVMDYIYKVEDKEWLKNLLCKLIYIQNHENNFNQVFDLNYYHEGLIEKYLDWIELIKSADLASKKNLRVRAYCKVHSSGGYFRKDCPWGYAEQVLSQFKKNED